MKKYEITGYIRKDGSVGIRNHLLILPSVVCANNVVKKIAGKVDNAAYVTHEHGCGHGNPEDLDQVKRTLEGYGSNPNVGACLVVGLGCEDVSAKEIAEKIAETGKPTECILIQEEGGTSAAVAKGIEKAKKLYRSICDCKREIIDFKDIIMGLECGGSDATSGIVANPAIGKASDLLIEQGGTSILAETTEHVGAEMFLAERAESPEVKKAFLDLIKKVENRAKAEGIELTNLAPGNIEGGLSTPEEKSLGCILKGGSAPLREVLKYAERPTKKGLVVQDTPGFDIESITGMAASGAQIFLFSTGRGTPGGCAIAPVIKITGNPDTYQRLKDDMDVDAGTILRGDETIESMGEKIFDFVVRVINGEETRTEIHGCNDFSITRCGFSY